jgi:hypothetical protein
MALCAACSSGPGGLKGHATLILDLSSPLKQSTFTCRECGAHYRRDYTVAGTFTWIFLSQDQPP